MTQNKCCKYPSVYYSDYTKMQWHPRDGINEKKSLNWTCISPSAQRTESLLHSPQISMLDPLLQTTEQIALKLVTKTQQTHYTIHQIESYTNKLTRLIIKLERIRTIGPFWRESTCQIIKYYVYFVFVIVNRLISFHL